ncbi:MAG: hypothetical protein JWN72_1262 [Thermoleophilia bacterium]|nr:hypothetical protein [Thermoleophilia bacterium]
MIHDTTFSHIDQLVLVSSTLDTDALDTAERVARTTLLARVELAQQPVLASSTRRLRWVAVVALAGAAILAGMLTPGRGGSGGAHRDVPLLAANASAAETLTWAGEALVADDAPGAGSGTVWHGVASQYRSGTLVRLRERWIEQDGDARKEFAWFAGDAKFPPSAYTVTYDGTTERGRNYTQPTPEGEWTANPHQLDLPGGMRTMGQPVGGPPGLLWRNGKTLNGDQQDPADYPVRRVSSTVSRDEGLRRWVHTAASAHDQAALSHATYVFLRTTRGEFLDDVADRNPAAVRATTVRQLIQLLSVARVSPTATQAIYDEFLGLGDLVRLDDVKLDGHRAVRIQYDLADISNSILEIADPDSGNRKLRDEETVLVIDAITGALLRTESLDRRNYTEYTAAARVHAVGEDPAGCTGAAPRVPCGLIAGTAAAAREADRLAATAKAVQMGEGMTQAQYQGELDDEGLPTDDYDRPIRYLSEAEAARRGYANISCSGYSGGPQADPHVFRPDPNVYCQPIYPLAELPGRRAN